MNTQTTETDIAHVNGQADLGHSTDQEIAQVAPKRTRAPRVTHAAATVDSTDDPAAQFRTLRDAANQAEAAATEAKHALVEAAKARRPFILAELAENDAILGFELTPETAPARKPRTNKAKAEPAAPSTKASPVAKTSAPKPTKAGRLPRRSTADLEAAVAQVVKALKDGPQRSEAIQRFTGLDKQELPRVLKLGIANKTLKSKGEKRATEYSVR